MIEWKNGEYPECGEEYWELYNMKVSLEKRDCSSDLAKRLYKSKTDEGFIFRSKEEALEARILLMADMIDRLDSRLRWLEDA